MKKFGVLVFLLAMAISVNSLAEVKNVFINGVGNTQKDAEKSRDALQDRLRGKVDDHIVQLYHNQTAGYLNLPDFWEAAMQVHNYDGMVKTLKGRFIDKPVSAKCSSSLCWYAYYHPGQSNTEMWKALGFYQYFSRIPTLQQRLENGMICSADGDISKEFVSEEYIFGSFLPGKMYNQHLSTSLVYQHCWNNIGDNPARYTNPDSLLQQDYEKMYNNVISELRNDNKLNIIAHSQGNMFANIVLDSIGNESDVRLLSVATPHDEVFGNGKYITLYEDLVSLSFLGSLPRNKTNYSSSFWDHSDHSIADTISYNRWFYNDWTGHGFAESYLKRNSTSENFIVSNFVKNYNDLVESETPRQWSDIYVTNARLSKSSVFAGEKVKAYSYQRYRGNVRDRNLRSSKLGYYLSKDKIWNSGDIYLDYDTSSLGSDDTAHYEREYLTIPSSTQAGNYYILFIGDYRNYISEINEGNNVVAVSLKVKTPLQGHNDDIYFGYVRVYDTSLYRGQKVKLKAKVRYRGNSTRRQLGRVYTSFYISRKYSFDSSATYLGYRSSTIGSDDHYDYEYIRVRIPRNYRRGTAYIHFVTDDKKGRKRINETNEWNNFRSVRVRIR